YDREVDGFVQRRSRGCELGRRTRRPTRRKPQGEHQSQQSLHRSHTEQTRRTKATLGPYSARRARRYSGMPSTSKLPPTTQAAAMERTRERYPQPDCPTAPPASPKRESRLMIVARCSEGMFAFK